MSSKLVAVEPRRARRWLWVMLGLAVLATGTLFRAWGGGDGARSAVVFLVSALVALTSTAQAARLLAALNPAGGGEGRTGERARSRH